MKFYEMYPSNMNRLYAADFNGKAVTLTIKSVTNEVLGKGSASEKILPVWRFEETDKTFPAVKTNGVCARAMFGDDSDAWVGHRITLYPAPDDSGLSDDGLCIRVKGSPELDKPLKFRAQIGRSKVTQTLVPTPRKTQDAAPATETALSADLATSERNGNSHAASESLSGQIFADEGTGA